MKSLIVAGALWASASAAINLFVASSEGKLTTLSLTTGPTNLTVASVTKECADNPAGLELDFASRVLYCLDRAKSNAVNGSLNSFSIGEGGNLSRIDRVDSPASGVYLTRFGGVDGNPQGIATVSLSVPVYLFHQSYL